MYVLFLVLIFFQVLLSVDYSYDMSKSDSGEVVLTHLGLVSLDPKNCPLHLFSFTAFSMVSAFQAVQR